MIYINNEESLNLTKFNDDFIRKIIRQMTILSATQIIIRFVGGFELDETLPLQKWLPAKNSTDILQARFWCCFL